MISVLVFGIRVDENREISSIGDEEGHESSGLVRRESGEGEISRGSNLCSVDSRIYFEHCSRMRSNRVLPELVTAKFGEFPARRRGQFRVVASDGQPRLLIRSCRALACLTCEVDAMS